MDFVIILLGAITIALFAYRYNERENENFNITLNTILILFFSVLFFGYLIYLYFLSLKRKTLTKKEYKQNIEYEQIIKLYNSFFEANNSIARHLNRIKNSCISNESRNSQKNQLRFTLETLERIYKSDHSSELKIKEFKRINEFLEHFQNFQ